MKDLRSLQAWHKAPELTLACYRQRANVPSQERYGFTTQLRRCSASMVANIAEGCGWFGNTGLHRFRQIARGLVSELDYHLLLSHDLGFFEEDYLQP